MNQSTHGKKTTIDQGGNERKYLKGKLRTQACEGTELRWVG
jgi:hypothetical protein